MSYLTVNPVQICGIIVYDRLFGSRTSGSWKNTKSEIILWKESLGVKF